MIVIGEFGRDRMEFCRFVPKTPQVSENNPLNRPALTVNQILTLAHAFFKSHGHWPYRDSGAIDELPGETWKTINKALQRGSRGLPAGKTLAGLLNQHRGIFVGRSRRLPRSCLAPSSFSFS